MVNIFFPLFEIETFFYYYYLNMQAYEKCELIDFRWYEDVHATMQLSRSFKCMQVLILSGNKIKEWPGTVLSSLPNLSCLKLDSNPLSQVIFIIMRGLSYKLWHDQSVFFSLFLFFFIVVNSYENKFSKRFVLE